MTNSLLRHVWYDHYTKILHIRKTMIRFTTNFGFGYCRVDATNARFLKLGVFDIRL